MTQQSFCPNGNISTSTLNVSLNASNSLTLNGSGIASETGDSWFEYGGGFDWQTLISETSFGASMSTSLDMIRSSFENWDCAHLKAGVAEFDWLPTKTFFAFM